MKTLIAYASKTGTAEKCARILAERIPDSTLCDLCKEKPDRFSSPSSCTGIKFSGSEDSFSG